ncbi:MAG: DUF1501 domain-containing protein [Bacteroidota bacterium]
MKRRNFLKYSGIAASATPLMINSIPAKAFATPMMAQSLDCSGLRERVLVIVQLFGGNDGLNTLVPIDQYARYRSLRPNIALPESGSGKFINLDRSLSMADQVGLNPHMTDFKNMYDNGLMSVIQGVGYENHNRSHFKSTDLIMTGGDGTFENFSFDTGWMGRYLDHSFPGLAGYSSPVMPDPLGIQLGNTESSLGFHIKGEFGSSINLSGQDLAGYYTLVSAIGGAPLANIPNSEYGQELSYALNIEESASNYSSRITSVFNKGSNARSYPAYDLANQLKTVARLINGGCQTKIYMVYIGGFDTHGNQLSRHTNLLTQLSASIKAFQDDLNAMGLDDRVLTATMSEFGRKAFENGNGGTDHGTLSNMMLFGSALKGGVYGTNLDLSVLDDGAPLNRQHDYRQVLTTLLQDWLGADKEALTAARFESFENQKLDLVRGSKKANSTLNCPVIDRNIGESGKLKAVAQNNGNQWHRVQLKRFYAKPVVVMGPASSRGSHPLSIRVRNISSHSFEWQVDEWDYLNKGAHLPIDISYLVIEAGSYQLSNGSILMAGVSENGIDHNWKPYGFEYAFSSAPAVFTQCSSGNGDNAVISRVRNVSKTGFEVRLQEEEANDQVHTLENLCWIAVERGSLLIGDGNFRGQATLSRRAVNHNDYTLGFGTSYAEEPVLLAQVQTFYGNNPFSIRYKNLEKNKVTVFLHEEQSKDTEIRHTKEKVAYLALEREGLIAGNPIESIPQQATRKDLNPFRINCYPNPVVSQFIIEPIHAGKQALKVDIIDLNGRIVFQQAGYSPQQKIKVEASHFPTGIYVVRLSSDQEMATFNIVKR